MELQGSVPFFDTEKLCRQPLFTGAPLRRGNLVVAEYSFARNALGHLPTPPSKAGKLAIKPVLTGPYTLAKFSVSGSTENGGSGTPATLEARAIAYGEILAPEIEALSQCGAEMIQIDEPAILRNPGEWSIIRARTGAAAARARQGEENEPQAGAGALCIFRRLRAVVRKTSASCR